MANVTFVLDEAASLESNLGCLKDAIDKYRGYGVRLQLYYQAPAQLKACFPNGQDQTVLANGTQIFFATNDYSTADYLSNRLGDQTIISDSGGTGSSYSTQMSGGRPDESTTVSSNTSHNWSHQGRRLLKPEEILAMDQRMAITFVPGMPPILTRLQRYYERSAAAARISTTSILARSTMTFLMATLLCGVCVFGSLAYVKESKNGNVRRNGEVRAGSRSSVRSDGNARRDGTRISPVPGRRVRPLRTGPVHTGATGTVDR